MNGPQRNRKAAIKQGRKRDDCHQGQRYEQSDRQRWSPVNGPDPYVSTIWDKVPAELNRFNGAALQTLSSNYLKFQEFLAGAQQWRETEPLKTVVKGNVTRVRRRQVTDLFANKEYGGIMAIGEVDSIDLEIRYDDQNVHLELVKLTDSEAYLRDHPGSAPDQFFIVAKPDPNPHNDNSPRPLEYSFLEEHALMIIQDSEQIFNLPNL